MFLAADRGLVLFGNTDSETDQWRLSDPEACPAWYKVYRIIPI